MNKHTHDASPPDSVEVLMQRVQQIAGLTLYELASLLAVEVPADLSRHKGWTGQLIERYLGASAGSRPEHDFPHLKIELKTLPISHQYTPLETTYVCYAQLMGNQGITWESCNVRHKLSHVLWIPVQGERDIAVADRVIGSGFLWQPNDQQSFLLKQDWEELMDMISLGHVESINARIGQVMQIRPKAADGKQLTQAIGHNGKVIETRPRGFYLRKNFTLDILRSAFD